MPLKSKETKSHLGRFLTPCFCFPPHRASHTVPCVWWGCLRSVTLIDFHAQPNGITLPRQIAEVPHGCHHAGVGKRDVDGGLKHIENEEMPSNPLKSNIWSRKSFVGSDSGFSPLIPFPCSRATPVGSGCLWNTVGKMKTVTVLSSPAGGSGLTHPLQGLLCKCDVYDIRPTQSYPMVFVISLGF